MCKQTRFALMVLWIPMQVIYAYLCYNTFINVNVIMMLRVLGKQLQQTAQRSLIFGTTALWPKSVIFQPHGKLRQLGIQNHQKTSGRYQKQPLYCDHDLPTSPHGQQCQYMSICEHVWTLDFGLRIVRKGLFRANGSCGRLGVKNYQEITGLVVQSVQCEFRPIPVLVTPRQSPRVGSPLSCAFGSAK